MPAKPAYTIADKQVIASTPSLRVTLMTLDPGQEIPWHRHSQVTDTAFCLQGEVEVAHKPPDETRYLLPGEHCETMRGKPHRVRCAGTQQCKVLLVQGVGEYDFLDP